MPSQQRNKVEEDIASVEGLGRAVRKLRKKRTGNRLSWLTERVSTPPPLYAVERGEMELTWGNVRRLADRLGVELDALVELAAVALAKGGERWRVGSWVAKYGHVKLTEVKYHRDRLLDAKLLPA